MKASVLLLTFNEERNLPPCLASLDWCDDIVAVDSGSTDRSVDLLNEAGVRVLHRPFDNFAAQRNFGLEHGAFIHDWVLHLDADELVTDHFRAALEALQPWDDIWAYNVPSKMILFGRWLRHAGMYPTYQVRLGHRDRLRFKQVGHGQREDLPAYQVGIFPEPYLHYSFSHGMRHWLEKHMRYAADEAELILTQRAGYGEDIKYLGGASKGRRRVKAYAARLPLWLRPIARFLYVYVLRQGFRDGRAGLIYALMLSVYEGITALLTYERLLEPRGK